LKARIKIKAPGISKINQKIRIKFAKKLKRKTIVYWNKVHFTDESKMFP
jgi:hypothetical protein